jgi:hypothetical protein
MFIQNILQNSEKFCKMVIGSGFSLVKIISILIVLFPSILFLKVQLTNKKIVGLIFAILSIYLLK